MSSPLDALPKVEIVRQGGVGLACRRLGSGPLVILLHGGPGLDHHIMLTLGERLAASAEVWLVDLPGHGASTRDGETPPDATQLVEATGRWLSGFDRAVDAVVAHSLGAWIARALARRGRLPGRRSVWMGPPISQEASGAPPPRAMAAKVRTGRWDARRLREELVEMCGEDVDALLQPRFIASLNQARLRPPAAYPRLLAQFGRVLTERLENVKPACPVLILAGTQDMVCPPEAAARLCAATQDSRIEVIEGAGHFPFATHLDETAEAVSTFLAAGKR